MDPHRSPSFPPASSPKLQWGSPALRPMASFPPMNRMTATPNVNTPPHRPPVTMHSQGGMTFERGMGSGSPQSARFPYQHSFRTPQPHHRSPNAQQPPWTESRGNRKQRFPKNQSPFGSPNVNPGGSDDITQYYNSSMLSDPWQNVPPMPVNHWQNQ